MYTWAYRKATYKNFHIKSRGEFVEIPAVPKGFKLFYSTSTSKYYTNEDRTILVRQSDHWGKKIKNCTWYLKNYCRLDVHDWQEFVGEHQIIGMIKFSDLIDMH